MCLHYDIDLMDRCRDCGTDVTNDARRRRQGSFKPAHYRPALGEIYAFDRIAGVSRLDGARERRLYLSLFDKKTE